MKKSFVVFKRQWYSSDTSGKVSRYIAPSDLCEPLGQAKTLMVHILKFGSDAGGNVPKAQLRYYHSASSSDQPIIIGIELDTLKHEFTTSSMVLKAGPFAGFVQPVLEIWENTSQGVVKLDLEICVTAIMEE